LFDTAYIKKHGLLAAGLLLFLFIFFKNAWVADDAYISFRSIEQVFAGHGVRWNIDERVQVYTSPLWFGLLLLTRIFTSNLFLSAIFLSAVCCVTALLMIRKLIDDDKHWLIFVLLITGVNGIMDFSSSGLENPLLYLLLSIFFYYYFLFFKCTSIPDKKSTLVGLLLTVGLISIARHDVATLIFMPLCYPVFVFCKNVGRHQALVFISGKIYLVLVPFLAWTIFSIIYYGVPFPNTAYAKMLHGIPRADLIDFGWLYLSVSLTFDFFAKLILLCLLVRVLWKREAPIIFLLLGVALNFFYVVYVGGDFMQGRFISEALFVAAIGLLAPGFSFTQQEKNQKSILNYSDVATLSGLVVLMLCVESPLKVQPDSGFDAGEGHRHYSWRGILNERNFYFLTNSLWAYVHRDNTQPFPDHKWCRMGINAAAQNKQASDFGGIGMYGYCAGLNLLVIDNLALGEPFLARLPMSQSREWRAGHYHRDLPRGYYESRLTRENHLQEPHLAMLWDDISQLDHEPLFTLARWQAIWRINIVYYWTGYYKNIGEYYFADLDSLNKEQMNP